MTKSLFYDTLYVMQNIRELLNQYNIRIVKDSSSNIMIRCLFPDHRDSDASFSIRKKDGLFHCFGCGKKGNYYTLYKLITGNYYYEPTTWVPMKYEKEIIEKLPIKIFGKLQSIPESEDITNFLKKIHISKKEINEYGIQYSKYTEMIAGHLLKDTDNEYTKMVDRIIFPIYKDNKLINVEGRSYTSLNKPKVLYPKGADVDWLYGYDRLDLLKDVILVEGLKDYFSVLKITKNVVAMLHAIPTIKQLELLETIQGNLIAFIDNDEGGQRTLSFLDEFYSKEFKFCKSYKTIMKDGKEKGYSPSNCSLKEIETIISKAQYFNESLVDGLFNDEKITW